MDRNYYEETYINKWEECLEEARKENAQDVGEIATYIFEELKASSEESSVKIFVSTLSHI